jgi:hypothetical protein
MRLRITPLGGATIVVLLGSVAAALLASGALQTAGFVVGVIVVLLIAGEGLGAYGGGSDEPRKVEVALSRYSQSERPVDSVATRTAAERDELWARERERRQQRDR